MTAFFGSGRGLAVFLNAGDPPWPRLGELVAMLDERGVDCLELAVPFPDSPTDGPVIRESARRALGRGAGLERTLEFVSGLGPRRMRVVLLADWHHSLRDPGAISRIAASGADALLPHGLPPRLFVPFHERAAEAGLPVVTTCYPASPPEVKRRAVRYGTAYLYLVAGYGRSGAHYDHAALAPAIAELRGGPPVAVGFGVRDRGDVDALHRAGADAVIVGSAAVARAGNGRELEKFVTSLRPSRSHR